MLYLDDNQFKELAFNFNPSARSEYQITDLIKKLL